MFKEKHLKSNRIRIAIGIMIFVALLSNAQAGDWPMKGHDAARTGVADEVVEPPLELLWKYMIGSSVGSLAVSGSMIYVGSDDNNVYALDAATGILIWKYTTGGAVSSPAVSGGLVYVGSADGNVYAIDAAKGNLKWKYTTMGGIYGAIYSSPAISDGVVYVGASDKRIYALDAATGALKWDYRTRFHILSDPAVYVGMIYLSASESIGGGDFYVLDATTGALKWNYSAKSIPLSPAVSDGVVYVGSFDNNVYAFDAKTGTLKLKYTTGDIVGSLAVSGKMIYVGSYDNNVYAFDTATGILIWKYTTGGAVGSPAVSGGVVYAGSEDGNVYAIDAKTGNFKWKYSIGSYVYSSPAISGGVVYVGSVDGNVYAFAPQRSYTFQTTDNSMQVTVDGTVHNSPYTINWTDGTTHSINVLSSKIIVPGQSQYVFTAWNGMSASTSPSISINAGASTAGTYSANYKKQYYLTVNSNPTELTSISGNGWYDSGTTATTGTAPGTSGSYTFSAWKIDGNPTSGNPVSVLMNAPHTATAVYQLSVNSSTGNGIVYFDTTAGTFQDLVAIKEEDWPNGACGYKLDYGLFSFNITNIPEGESVTMTLTFPRDLDSNTEYLKFGKNKTNNAPHWYLINSTLNGKNLTFKLTDGGSGDDDLKVNGRIKDDGGPVTLAGDLNGNGIPADAGDLVLMKRASIGEIQADPRYDLNKNGINADAGDLVLMKRASIGEIILS